MADIGAVVTMWSAVAGNTACVASVVIMVRGRKDITRLEHDLETSSKGQDQE